jgi:predicted transcriptional regulator
MATSTTLKLPDDLKARILPLARSTGKTPHAWMVEALQAQAELAEMRRSFVNDAYIAAAEVDAGGALYAMQDVQSYILARAAGKAVARPKPIKRGAGKKSLTRHKTR